MYLYSALSVVHASHSGSFTCNYINACLYLVSVHQTEVADI